jgi:16S rRNA processing protein RimM
MPALSVHTDKGGHIRIKFPGCDNPETARLYGNLLIGVTRDQLSALSLGEHYWSDLEGLAVTNKAGILLGKVSHLFSTGANDVLVVKGDRERLLPYINDVVIEVDPEKNQMIVDWDADF